jgi:hypothetical protein
VDTSDRAPPEPDPKERLLVGAISSKRRIVAMKPIDTDAGQGVVIERPRSRKVIHADRYMVKHPTLRSQPALHTNRR